MNFYNEATDLCYYVINGSKFRSERGFYNYVENVETLLTENLNWKIGRNLDAFDDILEGGFGKHDYDEKIIVRWMNYRKSEEYLDSRFLNPVVEILTEKENVEFERFDYQIG